MATTRTHIVLPDDVLREIDKLAGKRGRSAFLVEIARREIQRQKIMKFLERTEPVWKLEDHPELKHGAAAWVTTMRRSDERMRNARRRSLRK